MRFRLRTLKKFQLGKIPLRRGFTLIELLAVIGISGFLAVLLVGAVRGGVNSANKVREIAAARNLVAALQTSAAENNGEYVPGMDYRAGSGSGTDPVYNTEGQEVLGHAAQRYPYRIAPYLDNEFNGTIFVNRNKTEIAKSTAGSPAMYDYLVSTYPALGMNIYCVGGVVRWDGSVMNPEVCISRSANMTGSILAFASAGSGVGSSKRHGFSYVSPPTKESGSPYCLKWDNSNSWSSSRNPMNFGWVDFRHGGKAVCAFLDGSVRLCPVEELNDMRLWTHAALQADDPNYTLVQ